MIRFLALHPGLPERRDARLGVWGGALLLHFGVALALSLGEGRAWEPPAAARPIEVRMLEPERPPEPVRPPPPPPQASTPPKPVVTPLPIMPVQAPPPPTTPSPESAPAVIATSAPTHSAMTVAPAVARPAPVVERVAPLAAPPLPLIEARYDADYLANPSPSYPMASRRLGEAGTVHLRVHVGPEGMALKVELKSGSGFQRLDQSALDAVARWRFVPARRGATAVASWVVVPIIFSLI